MLGGLQVKEKDRRAQFLGQDQEVWVLGAWNDNPGEVLKKNVCTRHRRTTGWVIRGHGIDAEGYRMGKFSRNLSKKK